MKGGLGDGGAEELMAMQQMQKWQGGPQHSPSKSKSGSDSEAVPSARHIVRLGSVH